MLDTNSFFEKIRFKYIQPNEKKGIKYKILKKIKKTFNKNDIINLDKSKLSSEDLVFLNELEKIKDEVVKKNKKKRLKKELHDSVRSQKIWLDSYYEMKRELDKKNYDGIDDRDFVEDFFVYHDSMVNYFHEIIFSYRQIIKDKLSY